MKKQKIALIAAISENRVLGLENKLVWHLPTDWANFKKVTKGTAFIMGRKSYESADGLYSDRLNVILSRQQLDLPKSYMLAHSLEEAMRYVQEESIVFILGGGQIFEQSIGLANYMYLTIVHYSFEGDSFFPEVDWSKWELVKSIRHEVDEAHAYPFSLNEYKARG